MDNKDSNVFQDLDLSGSNNNNNNTIVKDTSVINKDTVNNEDTDNEFEGVIIEDSIDINIEDTPNYDDYAEETVEQVVENVSNSNIANTDNIENINNTDISNNDTGDYNEPYIAESFVKVTDKLKNEFYTKFAKREDGDFDEIDFTQFTQRAIEVIREDFAKTTLEKARNTTIQQSKCILDVFKSHIAHDAVLKRRLEQKFGPAILEELEVWDKSKNDKDLEKFTHNQNINHSSVGVNNTSLFLEIARYLFSPYIQFPELFADDKPDKVSVAEVFNYANVIDIERTTNDDIQKQFTRFETDDKIQKLFMNNKDLAGIFEKIKYDSYKIHTYFSVFILLWSSPFDERDYGIQQYSKSIALLSEKMVQFVDNLNNLDKQYPKDEFAKRIHKVVLTHLDTFEEGLKALDRASISVDKKTMEFFDKVDQSLTRFQRMQRELSSLTNFGSTLARMLKEVEQGIGETPRVQTLLTSLTNSGSDNVEILHLLSEINAKLDRQNMHNMQNNVSEISKTIASETSEKTIKSVKNKTSFKEFLSKLFK